MPVYDAQTSFRNGQNQNDTDGAVGGSYFAGLNVRPLGDDLVPRYPYRSIETTLQETGIVGEISLSSLLESGNPQAFIPVDVGDGYFILIINGRWFRVDGITFEITRIFYEQGSAFISDHLHVVNWLIADDVVVVYDGDLPLIYEGGSLVRRSNLERTYTFVNAQGNLVTIPTPELIRGYLGYYNQLRIWQAISTNVIAVSDILGEWPGAPLTMQESFTDGGDYTNQFPSLTASYSAEVITAMGQFVTAQTTQGFGELFVSTNKQIYTISSVVPRDQWQTTAGFIKTLLPGTGIAGQLAWDNLNYDLGFIDPSGRVNSLFFSADQLTKWDSVSIDKEVENYITTNNPELYKYANFNKFASMALATSNPYYTKRIDNMGEEIATFAFKGMLALSLENLSGLNQPATPKWAGLWTGINPMFLAELRGVLYALSDDNGVNQIYAIEEKIGPDTYRGKPKDIISRVHFRNFRFQDSTIFDKQFESIDVSLENILGSIKIKTEFRPTESNTWMLIGCREFKNKGCFPDECSDIIKNNKSYLSNYKFVIDPLESCEQSTRFRLADIRLTFQGTYRLRHFRLQAELFADANTTEFNEETLEESYGVCDNINDYNLYTTFNSISDEIINEHIFSTENCRACT